MRKWKLQVYWVALLCPLMSAATWAQSFSWSASPSHGPPGADPESSAEGSHVDHHLAAAPPGWVQLQVRSAFGGPFAHRWLEVGDPSDTVTISYGPANLPFLDAGQIVVRDQAGHVEWVSRWHLLPGSFTHFRLPGAGHSIGSAVLITRVKAQRLITRERRHRFVAPYIPFFHDCHTFVCATLASARGQSTLPCYLLFKGHW